MVTSASHFFAFHWLCCLIPIGYLPKPGSVGVRICHYHRIQPRLQFFRYLRPDAPVFNINRISAITLLILSLSGCSSLNILWYTAPVDMMTFRWSHLSYHTYLSTTSAVFTPAGHVNILQYLNQQSPPVFVYVFCICCDWDLYGYEKYTKVFACAGSVVPSSRLHSGWGTLSRSLPKNWYPNFWPVFTASHFILKWRSFPVFYNACPLTAFPSEFLPANQNPSAICSLYISICYLS